MDLQTRGWQIPIHSAPALKPRLHLLWPVPPKPVATKPPPFYVSGQREVEFLSIPLLTRFDLRTIYKFGKHFGDLNRDTACCLIPGTATTTEQ